MQQRKGPPATSESALAKLYQCYVSILLNYIRRYVSVREDAEDILVEVFLAAHEHGDSLAPRREPTRPRESSGDDHHLEHCRRKAALYLSPVCI
ncbi:MAG TPA: sigma factor [Ktedonobacteraceae bacterium]|nr:sigma factor [Ktedonobacteraceae bacterium]